MSSSAVLEIEKKIEALSDEERLLLLEWLARGLRKRYTPKPSDWEEQLAAMAADPNIQREIQAINEEFACTEMDGLE